MIGRSFAQAATRCCSVRASHQSAIKINSRLYSSSAERATENKSIQKVRTDPTNVLIRTHLSHLPVLSTIERFVVGYITKTKSLADARGALLYLNLSDIEYMDFVTRFNMPDEFTSWFLISELHAWMLMVRTANEEVQPMGLRDGVNRMFWDDTIKRMKPLHLKRSQLYDALEDFGASYRYATVSYDEGLDDDKVMASALWNRFFRKECEDYEQLALLLKYVRINIAALDRMGTGEFVMNRKVQWVTLDQCELL